MEALTLEAECSFSPRASKKLHKTRELEAVLENSELAAVNAAGLREDLGLGTQRLITISLYVVPFVYLSEWWEPELQMFFLGNIHDFIFSLTVVCQNHRCQTCG